jgi:hypothetical protein
MTDWQTNRYGYHGTVLHWSGCRDIAPQSSAIACAGLKGPNNGGKFMLIHKASSTVLLGAGYSATPEMILEFVERERVAARH